MENEPQWLDIEDQLYPPITMLKSIVFIDEIHGPFQEKQVHVVYNSLARQIDLTDIIINSLFRPFTQQDQTYVFIYNEDSAKFQLLGLYPFDNSFILGEEFLHVQLLTIMLSSSPAQPQCSQKNVLPQSHKQCAPQLTQGRNFESQLAEYEHFRQEDCEPMQEGIYQFFKEGDCQPFKEKKVRNRTVREMLLKVSQWRKIHVESKGKISLQQAAESVQVTKRTLEDYFMLIKQGEKCGFEFEKMMDKKVSELRKFVREKYQNKKVEPLILTKFMKPDK